jgi:hypothetical protein
LDRFVLRYSGRPSKFEGETTIPEGAHDVRLQILAADQAGNSGQHSLPFRISP